MNRPRVAVIRCESYDPDLVEKAVRRGVDLLGGPSRYFGRGEKIVLKPNLLVASTPDKAVTTHPSIFRAVALLALGQGAQVSWGDSPGFGSTEGAARRSGILEVASELALECGDFSTGVQVSHPEGSIVKQFTLAKAVVESDGLITLPKLKTHALTRMTGAVKNQFGCVPGLLKGEFHARMPDVDTFCRMLVDLNNLIKPRLVVMDAVVAMEGNGPRGGDPRQAGVLLVSDDLVAADTVGCLLMHLDPNLISTVTWGERLGLGSRVDIELLGDELPELEPFVANRNPASTSGAFGSALGRRLLSPRPYIVAEGCTRCGTCVKVCPVDPKAVEYPNNDRSRIPEHDYSRCIRCYCCQEMCPEHTIHVRTPMLGRIIGH